MADWKDIDPGTLLASQEDTKEEKDWRSTTPDQVIKNWKEQDPGELLKKKKEEKPKSTWKKVKDFAFDTAAEIPRVGAEAVVGAANAVNAPLYALAGEKQRRIESPLDPSLTSRLMEKAGKGVGGLAAGAGAMAGSGSLEIGLKEAGNFIGDENPLDQPAYKNVREPIRNTLQVAGDTAALAGIYPGVNALSAVGQKITPSLSGRGWPLTAKAAKSSAADVLEDRITPKSPEEAALFAQRQKQTNELQGRTGIETPTISQSTGNNRIARLEQRLGKTHEDFADSIADQDARIQGKVNQSVKNIIPGDSGGEKIQGFARDKADRLQAREGKTTQDLEGKTAKYYAGDDSQTLGGKIVAKIQDKLAPVKAEEQAAWEKIPNYEIPSKNFDSTVKRTNSEPLPADVEAEVKNITGDYQEKMPRTFKGLKAIRTSITNKIRDGVSTNAERVLNGLIKSIDVDFEEIGAAAKKGDIAVYNGKVVNPSAYRSLEDTLTKQLKESLPIAERQLIESQLRFVKDTISGSQPAEDLSAAYKTARQKTFDLSQQFRHGVTDDIFDQGNQITGRKIADEKIPARYSTASGADDLIRAIGKDDAAALMKDHFGAEMIKKVENAATRDINPKSLTNWLQQNKTVLKKYGLFDDFSSVKHYENIATGARQQLAEFQKSTVAKLLDTEPQEAIGKALSGPNPSKSMEELIKFGGGNADYQAGLKSAFREYLMKKTKNTTENALESDNVSRAKAKALIGDKYAIAMEKLYTPDEIQSIYDYAQTVRMLSKNKNVSTFGGSTTADTLSAKTKTVIGESLKDGAAATMGPMAKIVKGVLKGAGDLHEEAINRFLISALLDPQKASDLLKIAKGNRNKVLANRVRLEIKLADIEKATISGVVSAAAQPSTSWGQ